MRSINLLEFVASSCSNGGSEVWWDLRGLRWRVKGISFVAFWLQWNWWDEPAVLIVVNNRTWILMPSSYGVMWCPSSDQVFCDIGLNLTTSSSCVHTWRTLLPYTREMKVAVLLIFTLNLYYVWTLVSLSHFWQFLLNIDKLQYCRGRRNKSMKALSCVFATSHVSWLEYLLLFIYNLRSTGVRFLD